MAAPHLWAARTEELLGLLAQAREQAQWDPMSGAADTVEDIEFVLRARGDLPD